jgi:S-(hydroxymethyl)glutathione dehydrogenase/alcohol dehydrogenase
MRAAVIHAPGTGARLEEVDLDGPREGEVLVRIAASGICGSDIHALHGRGNAGRTMPVVLGHEGAGVVEAVGPGVRDLKPGDAVVMAMFGPCGHCQPCSSGRLQFCEGPETKSAQGLMPDGSTRLSQAGQAVYPFVGVGSLADYAVMRQTMVVKVPPGLPLDRLCFTACSVTTGLGAVFNVAAVRPGDSVAVIGCGGVGLNVVQGARIAGASRIIAIDRKRSKLDLAATLGATDCIEAGDDPAATLAAVRALEPRGVSHAFEVVGGVALVRQALAMTARGGTAVMVGSIPWDQDVPANAGLLFGERRLVGCLGGSNIPGREISRIVALYQSGRLRLDELVGTVHPLDQVGAALAQAERADAAKTVGAIAPDLLCGGTP